MSFEKETGFDETDSPKGTFDLRDGIRRVAALMLLLFLFVALNITYLQVTGAENLQNNPANTRGLIREYSLERGAILSSDDKVLAESVPRGDSSFVRSYPSAGFFAHVIGYDSMVLGRSGLERQYNDYLLGKKGSRTIVDYLLDKRAPGCDIVTTLDTRVQEAAYKSLAGRTGSVVAINPVSGAVLAMVSSPGFDPNSITVPSESAESAMNALIADPLNPLFNRASMGLYAPGSTFKILTAAAAIERSGMQTDKSYECEGTIIIGDVKVTDYGTPPRRHGTLSMKDALKVSCNNYFAQLAVEIGGGELFHCAESFGINKKAPIDIESSKPQMPPASEMDEGEVAWTGVGQGRVLMTPLSLCLIGCAIANDGKIMVPHFMDMIKDHEGKILENYEPSVWLTPISPETADAVMEMMVEVVSDGTGRAAAIRGVSVAGKTGTAEAGGRDNDTWFIAIAPASNPRIVVAVSLENSGGTGGEEAAPVAKEVIEAFLDI